jgi:hypothetical protein
METTMKKLFLIGWKDLRLAFRDRAALVLMLLAPLLLTLGLGAVTGRFSGGSSTGISHIPVVLVNQDGGLLGNDLVACFNRRNWMTWSTRLSPTTRRPPGRLWTRTIPSP